jgi:hypothetical protein
MKIDSSSFNVFLLTPVIAMIDLCSFLSNFNIFYLDAAGQQPMNTTSENGWMESILLSFLPT